MKVVPNVCLLISKMMLLKGNKTLMELIVYVNRQKQAKLLVSGFRLYSGNDRI